MQLNVRISQETRRQLDALIELYGESEGAVIRRLIDREAQRMETHYNLPIEEVVVQDRRGRASDEGAAREEYERQHGAPAPSRMSKKMQRQLLDDASERLRRITPQD